MTFAEWHPDDERLLTRYLDGQTTDHTLDVHLSRCRPCAQRMESLTRDLDRLHRAVSDSASEVFDDARLDRQRRAIRQRLGATVPARVLPFPAVAAARRAPIFRFAAAVLLIAVTGAGVVRILQLPQQPTTDTVFRAVAGPAGTALAARGDTADAAVLEDIDLALLRPRTAELRALDELTPHVRDLGPRR